MSGGVTDVLKFLSDSFLQGKSYSSVNILRSMLSKTLNFGTAGLADVGKHPLVVQLMRGMFNIRPSSPKYSSTWNPSVVLNFFDGTAQRTLSRLQLARKTVMLLALTTLLRCAELASIQADSIIISDSEASFTLGKLRKSQHTGPLQRISVPAWRENVSICPVACLEAYILNTATVRNAVNNHQLFIGSTKPFKPVTSSTISRWLKDQLKEAGVDTAIFSAHSTRGAAASKAASAGVCIQAILKQGHWAKESTFAKFYRRDPGVDSLGSVGASVLTQEASPI